MKKWLRKLADDHAILFWILSLFIFYFLLYKLPALTIFESDDTALCMLRYADAFLLILYAKWIYDGEITMGFQNKNFGKGLWWIALFMLIPIIVHFCGKFPHALYLDSLVYGLVLYVGVGLLEEVMVRGFLINTMMRHWKDNPKRARKSLFWSSVIFGLLHLGNLFTVGIWYLTLGQVVYATAIGFAFGSVYLRTKNLWPGVILHCIVDFLATFSMVSVPLSQMGTENGGGFAWYSSLSGIGAALLFMAHVLAVVMGLVLVRKSKRAEIERVWSDSPESTEIPAL